MLCPPISSFPLSRPLKQREGAASREYPLVEFKEYPEYIAQLEHQPNTIVPDSVHQKNAGEKGI